MAGGGDGGQFVQPLDRAQFCFHRLDKQALSVFRRDAGVHDGDIKDRDLNVWVGFFGDRDIG